MKKNLFYPLFILAMAFVNTTFAQVAQIKATSAQELTTPPKPISVPEEVWSQFLASIDDVPEYCSWSAEIALLQPYMEEAQIVALVHDFFAGLPVETFKEYKNRRNGPGCKANTRYICVIRDC